MPIRNEHARVIRYRCWGKDSADEEYAAGRHEYASFGVGAAAQLHAQQQYGAGDPWDERVIRVRDLETDKLYDVTVRRYPAWDYRHDEPKRAR